MSQDEQDDSNYSNSDKETKEKSQDLVKYSKKNIFLYDKKCRTVLHLGVLYKNLTKAAANSINLDKITSKIQSMIDKNQIYLRDAGPIILGITKIVVKKTYILFEDIEELTKLKINSKDQNRITNKENKEITATEDDENEKENILKKDLNIKGKQIIGNELKESTGTSALNINSFDDDILNLRNSHLLAIENSVLKNKKNTNKYSDLTFSKDIIELNNDDMIRRTIQKMSRLNDSELKNIFSTNKKSTNKNLNINDIKFDTDNKNTKTLENLREMLFNNNNNNKTTTNNFSESNFDLSNQINLDNNNIDNNNKDVEGFFTVIKSQIEDTNNNGNNKLDEIIDTDGNNDINFNFEINVNDLQNDNFNSNIKYQINKDDPISNNLKTKKNKKTQFMLKGKLKYDEEIELDMDEDISTENLSKKRKEELEKKLENENQTKLENIQINFNIFNFDKNKITSFGGEKYEYLLPRFLEARDEEGGENRDNESELKGIRKEENISDSNTKLNLINNSNMQSSDKNDMSRLNRLTTSNKKRISLGNFDSESKLLMHNLSRMTLDKNDFKGSTSFIERIKEIDKENNKKKDYHREDDNNDNINNTNLNDIDLIQQDDINNDNDNFEDYKDKEKDKVKYISEDIKEEEDAVQLKEDLVKNVFVSNKKPMSFNKIRNKLENREKFVEPKLFYDLLLLAQKGDVEMTQKKIMNNESINICLKN